MVQEEVENLPVADFAGDQSSRLICFGGCVDVSSMLDERFNGVQELIANGDVEERSFGTDLGQDEIWILFLGGQVASQFRREEVLAFVVQ